MKLWTKIAIALTLLVLAAGAALTIALNRLKPEVEKQINEQMKERCRGCDFAFEDLDLGWRGIRLEKLKLDAGQAGGQRVQTRAQAVFIQVELVPLLKKDIRVDRVTVIKPQITFFDGELKAPAKPKPANEESGGFEFSLNKVVIENAEFTYVRDVKDTHAELHIHKIDATVTVKDVDNEDLAQAKRARVAAHIEGQIGGSGHVEIDTTASIKKGPLYIDTDIAVKDQNLEDLSRFFQPNAGVELHGTLTAGKGRIEVRGNKATAKLKAEYKDFKLKVHKMYDRDGFQAFFTNLGTAIAMKEKNQDLPPEKKRETAHITREDGESIVSFMLRGLKEAAIDVTL